MKKRIGTKLYDTDTAVLVLPENNLYRTQKNQTYFTFDGQTITPVEFDQAAEMISTAGAGDDLLKRRPNYKGKSTISISAEYATRLAAYCRRHNVSQISVIEAFIDELTKNE